MGHCLVVYDISHDRTRTRVADVCLDYGLDRIQYSAFLGTLTHTHQEELMLRLARLLGKREGNIQLYPLCQKDWQGRQVIENKAKDNGERSPGGPRGQGTATAKTCGSKREARDGEAPRDRRGEDVLTPEEQALGVETIDL